MSFADAVALAGQLESIGEDKAGKAWTYKLQTYAIPVLGHMPITTIQRDHIARGAATHLGCKDPNRQRRSKTNRRCTGQSLCHQKYSIGVTPLAGTSF